MYILINCSEDGDISVRQYDKDALLIAIKEKDYGDIEFFERMPTDSNPQYWENNALIIKGEIVSPKPVNVVKEYEI